MNVIIVEGVLFLTLVVLVVMLVVVLVRHYTGVGLRSEQHRNRKAIDRAISLTCAVHGTHDARDMVRLDSGEVMCPECYREAIDGAV